MTPKKKIHVLIPRTYENVTIPSKRNFAHVINLKILRSRDDPGLSQGPHVVLRVLRKGTCEGEGRRRQGDNRNSVMWPPRNAKVTCRLGGTRNEFGPAASRKNQA